MALVSDLHSLCSRPPLPCAMGPRHPAPRVTTRVMGIHSICDSVGTHTEALVNISRWYPVGGIRSEKVCVFCFCSVLFLLTLTLYYFKLYNIMICCLYIYNIYIYCYIGLPLWLSWQRICLQWGRPGLGRSTGEGKGYPLHCSGLENSMYCIVHGVSKNQTRLSAFHFHILLNDHYSMSSWYSSPHVVVVV